MKSTRTFRGVVAVAALSLLAAACGDDADANTAAQPSASDAPAATMAPDTTAADSMDSTDAMGSTDATDATGSTDATDAMGSTAMASSEICDPDGLVAAVQGGDSEGTLEGMTDDPVATAASNNPVLTTLVAAVGAAGLGDTLNGAGALTVFAPTDCAFAQLDPATLDAALADPSGLLTEVLGFHVVAGERLSSEDLAGVTELETFTGAMLPIEVDGDTIMVGGGQAKVLVPDIQTANATVFLIDSVMLPSSG
ncbi:MAG: fasciclin domain-containing protein [Acidimicrobiia bacterium]